MSDSWCNLCIHAVNNGAHPIIYGVSIDKNGFIIPNPKNPKKQVEASPLSEAISMGLICLFGAFVGIGVYFSFYVNQITWVDMLVSIVFLVGLPFMMFESCYHRPNVPQLSLRMCLRMCWWRGFIMLALFLSVALMVLIRYLQRA